MKSNFTQLPNIIIKTPIISPQAKIVYAELLSYCWEGNSAFPSHERMCSHLGVTRQTLKRYLNELKEAKLITWKQRGHTKTNCYEFLPLDSLEKELGKTVSQNLAEFRDSEAENSQITESSTDPTDVKQNFTSQTSDVKSTTHHVVKGKLQQGQNHYQKGECDVKPGYHHDWDSLRS